MTSLRGLESAALEVGSRMSITSNHSECSCSSITVDFSPFCTEPSNLYLYNVLQNTTQDYRRALREY